MVSECTVCGMLWWDAWAPLHLFPLVSIPPLCHVHAFSSLPVHLSTVSLSTPGTPSGLFSHPDMASKTHEGITQTILSQAQTIVHEVYVSFVRKDWFTIFTGVNTQQNNSSMTSRMVCTCSSQAPLTWSQHIYNGSWSWLVLDGYNCECSHNNTRMSTQWALCTTLPQCMLCVATYTL